MKRMIGIGLAVLLFGAWLPDGKMFGAEMKVYFQDIVTVRTLLKKSRALNFHLVPMYIGSDTKPGHCQTGGTLHGAPKGRLSDPKISKSANPVRAGDKGKQDPVFLSHRGESDDAPENTMQAFQLAMDRGSDGIELDIRLTADGRVVCVHDANLKRVAGKSAVIANRTLAELRKIHPVPELHEVLAILRPGSMVQIELKGTAALLPKLRPLLTPELCRKLNVRISSFEEELLKEAADLFPELPRLLLIDLVKYFGHLPTAGETAALAAQYRATGISLRANRAYTAEFVRDLKARGLVVAAWGVSNDRLGLHMAEIGVDAMTCNHAVALRALWRAK